MEDYLGKEIKNLLLVEDCMKDFFPGVHEGKDQLQALREKDSTKLLLSFEARRKRGEMESQRKDLSSGLCCFPFPYHSPR